MTDWRSMRIMGVEKVSCRGGLTILMAAAGSSNVFHVAKLKKRLIPSTPETDKNSARGPIIPFPATCVQEGV